MDFKFQLDENGKVAWSLPLVINSATKASSAKKSAEKRKRDPLTERQPIQPLNLTPAQWKALTGEAKPDLLAVAHQANSNSAKNRKSVLKKKQTQPLKLTNAELKALDEPKAKKARQSQQIQKSVRKNLFTKEEPKARKSISNRSRLSKITKSKNTEKLAMSPLVSIEEVEESIINNNVGFPFKSPTQPVITFTKATPDRLATTKLKIPVETPKSDHTPNSQSSNEFLELERNFQEEEKMDDSPVSSVCNLLENTKIQSTKKAILSNNYSLKQTVEQISKIIEIEQIEFAQFQKKHQQRMDELNDILQNLERTCSNQNNEDSNNNLRRSLRLAKSPRPARNGKVVIASPVFTKSVDLRKTTLNRNLQNSTTKKARDMNSSVKANSSILATPRFDRTMTPNITKRTLNLRRDIQNQYSSLQETPAHK